MGCSHLVRELGQLEHVGVQRDGVDGLGLVGTNELGHGGCGMGCSHWARGLEPVVDVDDDELALDDPVEDLQRVPWEGDLLPLGIHPSQRGISQ